MRFSTIFLVDTAVYLLFALPACFWDVRKLCIPLRFVCVGLVALFAYRVAEFHHFYLFGYGFKKCMFNMLIAVATSALLFFCVRVLSAEGLGIGDVIFGVYSALYCGFYRNLVAAAFAALSGILFYLIAAVVKKVRKRICEKKGIVQLVHRGIFVIPFVPFITFGAVLAVFLI